jgi:hypothetical protein
MNVTVTAFYVLQHGQGNQNAEVQYIGIGLASTCKILQGLGMPRKMPFLDLVKTNVFDISKALKNEVWSQ